MKKDKEPEVTITTDRTVVARFGKRRPRFSELESIAHRHGCVDYEVSVYNTNASIHSLSDGPNWKAVFRRTESL